MGSVEIAVVQHVTKKSSDELLSKFADDSLQQQAQPRRKRTRREEGGESPQNWRVGERKSLLPPASRRSALLRRIGMSRSKLVRARGIKNKSLLGSIEKTWRRTIEGASKVFVEKRCNRHNRLITDIA